MINPQWLKLPISRTYFHSARDVQPLKFNCIKPAAVAELDAPSDWRPSRGFNPSFVEIDCEIFSTVILSLPLIQEGQLSVCGERMCTRLVNRLEN